MTAAAIILAAYAIALAVIFYGLFAGWFDLKVTRVVSPHLVELGGGRTITFGYPHGLAPGDRITRVLNGRPMR